MITIDDQIKCVEREIKMRERVYPRKVERQEMLEETAQYQIACMMAVLETLKQHSDSQLTLI